MSFDSPLQIHAKLSELKAALENVMTELNPQVETDSSAILKQLQLMEKHAVTRSLEMERVMQAQMEDILGVFVLMMAMILMAAFYIFYTVLVSVLNRHRRQCLLISTIHNPEEHENSTE